MPLVLRLLLRLLRLLVPTLRSLAAIELIGLIRSLGSEPFDFSRQIKLAVLASAIRESTQPSSPGPQLA